MNIKFLTSIVFFFHSIALFSVSFDFGVELTSNYLYKAISHSNNKPSLNTKIQIQQSGFYVGVNGFKVEYDKNDTLDYYNNKRTKATGEVDIYGGYEFALGSSSALSVGYVDKNYYIGNNLESNISSQYYALLNVRPMNMEIKYSYDRFDDTDPSIIELKIKDNKKYSSSFTYGWYLQSRDRYWQSVVYVPMKYLNIKGALSFTYTRLIPVIKDQEDQFAISYKL